MHVTKCEYISKEFQASNSNLDDFFRNRQSGLIIDSWVRENMVRHKINNWVLNEVGENYKSRILEIGGGLSYFTNYMSANYNYTNIDLLAHNSHVEEQLLKQELSWLKKGNWRNFDFGSLGICLSLDLFPNVDQGIIEFIRKAKNARTIILTLTTSELPRSYEARRIDGDEILTVVSWTLDRIRFELSGIIGNLEKLVKPRDEISPFNNGRDVFILRIDNDDF